MNSLLGGFHLAVQKDYHNFLGVKPGAVSPLALLNDKHNDVSFFIDHNLLSENILNFHPLVNHLTVSIKVTDFKYFLKKSK